MLLTIGLLKFRCFHRLDILDYEISCWRKWVIDCSKFTHLKAKLQVKYNCKTKLIKIGIRIIELFLGNLLCIDTFPVWPINQSPCGWGLSFTGLIAAMRIESHQTATLQAGLHMMNAMGVHRQNCISMNAGPTINFSVWRDNQTFGDKSITWWVWPEFYPLESILPTGDNSSAIHIWCSLNYKFNWKHDVLFGVCIDWWRRQQHDWKGTYNLQSKVTLQAGLRLMNADNAGRGKDSSGYEKGHLRTRHQINSTLAQLQRWHDVDDKCIHQSIVNEIIH